jgi:glycosyltransferase involved in cell wall biosynthesis
MKRRREEYSGDIDTQALDPPGAAPIRVLIVAPSLDMVGGQAVQAARLFGLLREEPGLTVSFVPINPRLMGLFRYLQQVRYVRTAVTSLYYLATLVARTRDSDLVHVFSASYLSFVLAPTPAILVAKLYAKKVLLNYRSGEAEDHLRRWHRTAIPTLRQVDAIVVPSRYLVEIFAKFGLRARPIFNIVDVGRLRFRDRCPLQPVFLSNRHLEPMYNVACVLRSFALVQRRFPGARLMVAGNGSQHRELEALTREMCLRDVQFIGRVAPESMGKIYDAADIYLNGSDIDNMPGSILEAFAAGLPVVTTDAGGIPYIVAHEETGMMVRRRDYQAMAACAIRLLEDEALASKITRQAREECRKYSWEAVRKDWVQLYQELVRGGGAGASEAGAGTEHQRSRAMRRRAGEDEA